MTLRYKNNVAITLASNITETTTTLSLTPGDGAQLPVIASGTADTFLLTLTDKNGNREIISICRRDSSSDTLYVGTGTAHQSAGNVLGRAQESTTALAITYTDDHTIELCATAAPLEAAVKYSDAGELTASTAEINGACDGCTATAAEINAACDGATAKNSHTHLLAGGATDVTASAAEINSVCDGCTATAAEINTACDGSTARNSHVHANITITAGTGISGGGALSENRTISHAAHTGDVTGAGALTIGAKKVLASMMNDGTNERGWVLARIAAAAVGAVGTYALCSGNNVPSTGLDPGDTISGSYLNYSDTTAGKYTTSTPSGTWMCMGRSVASYDATHYNGSPTLFLRIS